jgi:uncharacterized protein (UPF0332 family)
MKAERIEILIKHRLQQASEALNDARILLNNQGSPRSIVNRSYYALFYAALALLQRIGAVPSKHSGAISIFDREFSGKGILPKELSKSLHKAFELRQTSDYKVIEPVSVDEAESIFGEAVVFVDAVSEYLLHLSDNRLESG